MDFFVPANCGDDPEMRRRADLITGLAMLGGVFGTGYMIFYLSIGHNWGALVIVACMLAMLCVPFLMRTTGRVWLSGHLHVLIWTLGFSALAAMEGGVRGHAIAWLACGVPLIAFLMLRRRAALIWFGICFLSTLTFCALEIENIALPLWYPAEWHSQVTAAGYAGLAVFIALLGTLFNYSRNEALLLMQTAVAARHRTEQARNIAEGENRAKDQFLAILSHELRTPLTPILATVSAVDPAVLSPELRADLAMIQRNVELESKLIEDLLDLTRISRGKIVLHMEILDCHSCLRSALEICKSDITDKELHVSVDFLAGQHYARADPVRLRQVFWNLIRNAVKFTAVGGSINIATCNEADLFRVEISDTGIGIAPEVLPRIFEAFEQGERSKTRRFGGLGLGLSIAKAVVDLHHGLLSAFSEGEGKGATFTVELAAVSPPPAPQKTHIVPEQGKAANISKILLVEDDRDTLRILAKLLRKSGYEVTAAGCVEQGLALSATNPFDLLISDLGLPDGSGLDLMREIRQRDSLPGIALSGFGTDEDVRLSLAAGFEEHLVKPIDFATLRRVIQRVALRATHSPD